MIWIQFENKANVKENIFQFINYFSFSFRLNKSRKVDLIMCVCK